MSITETNIQIATVDTIKSLLEPIYERLDRITSEMLNQHSDNDALKYYRNKDLKDIFNISSNTIVKYRETGVLPYTKLGDIYLYERKAIDAILKENTIKHNLL